MWYKNFCRGNQLSRRRKGKGLTFFGTGLMACSGSACGGDGIKWNACGINGKCGGAEFKTGDGRSGTYLCAYGGLGDRGALASVLRGGRGGLTKFNSPGMLDLRRNWRSNCKPSKCNVA